MRIQKVKDDKRMARMVDKKGKKSKYVESDSESDSDFDPDVD